MHTAGSVRDRDSVRGRGRGDRGRGQGDRGRGQGDRGRGQGGRGQGGRGQGDRGRGRGRGGSQVITKFGKVQVVSNHFEIAADDPNVKIIRYRVSYIDTATTKTTDLLRPLRQDFRQHLLSSWLLTHMKIDLDTTTKLFYDGDNILLSLHDLDTAVSYAPLARRQGLWQVILVEEKRYFMSELLDTERREDDERNQMVDILFNAAASVSNCHYGRKFAPRDEEPVPLSEHPGCPYNDRSDCKARYFTMGHNQSTSLLMKGSEANWTVEIDAAGACLIPNIPMASFLEDKFGCPVNKIRWSDDRVLADVNKDIANLDVEFNYIRGEKRRKVVIGLTRNLTANSHKFENDGVETNITKYFNKQYGLTLRYPDLPVVQLKPKTRGIYVPLELLDFAKQRMMRRVGEKVKSVIGGIMTMAPQDRLLHIQKTVLETFGDNPVLRDCHIRVNPSALVVDAEVYRPPILEYSRPNPQARSATSVVRGQRKTVEICKPGSWNLIDSAFNECNPTRFWGLVDFSGQPQGMLKAFAEYMVGQAAKVNLRLEPVPVLIRSEPGDCLRNLEQVRVRWPRVMDEQLEQRRQRKQSPHIVVVLLPEVNTPLYEIVKSTLEKHCPSQCIVAKKFRFFAGEDRGIDGHMANILMKINQKLGGYNQALSDKSEHKGFRGLMGRDRNTVLIGIDTTLTAPIEVKGGKLPMICAMVGTTDPEASMYEHVFCSREMAMAIDDMGSLLTDLMGKICPSGAPWPPKVLVLRNGVSTGSIRDVSDYEVSRIKEAYADAGQRIPKIAYLITMKGNGARFFPTQFPDSRTNVTPGTIIVDNLRNPSPHANFYLVSQHGIKGTSKPCRYFVMCDDFQRPLQDWGHVMYYLCHLFGRATKSVSLPAPVYYAHLACDRVRLLCNKYVKELTGLSTLGGSSVDSRNKIYDVDVEQMVEDVNKFMSTMSVHPMAYV
ncbi:MAG: uncharacterized protein KVP18_003484 [Porospora cf. gigantea A]|uniref:uncharacterized protein n=1 Tax=Porospora cf. gigantea A TaxID=2853593 RepID=UPI00355A81D6|nr:MAG: hypothetical protein KVP18_003484 [Porospora cf. gigantea A]